MKSLDKSLIEESIKVMRSEKTITMKQLTHLLKCSTVTVKRKLKEWKAYTSYNHNGRHYTFPDIPEFDQYGLWKYKGICFSRHGNLKKTTIWIINNSKHGLSAFELTEILSLPVQTFLSHFKDNADIKREKHKGLYIYFSNNPEIYKTQKENRIEIEKSAATLDLPSDSEAVIILVELIKHPSDNEEKLVQRVQTRGYRISIKKVRALLIYHNIQKKTPSMKISGP